MAEIRRIKIAELDMLIGKFEKIISTQTMLGQSLSEKDNEALALTLAFIKKSKEEF